MSGAIKSGSIVDGNREERETQAKEKEFSQDETQQQIRENEDTFLEGLLAAADYAANEEMTFEINREGKSSFPLRSLPLARKPCTRSAENIRATRKTGVWGSKSRVSWMWQNTAVQSSTTLPLTVIKRRSGITRNCRKPLKGKAIISSMPLM